MSSSDTSYLQSAMSAVRHTSRYDRSPARRRQYRQQAKRSRQTRRSHMRARAVSPVRSSRYQRRQYGSHRRSGGANERKIMTKQQMLDLVRSTIRQEHNQPRMGGDAASYSYSMSPSNDSSPTSNLSYSNRNSASFRPRDGGYYYKQKSHKRPRAISHYPMIPADASYSTSTSLPTLSATTTTTVPIALPVAVGGHDSLHDIIPPNWQPHVVSHIRSTTVKSTHRRRGGVFGHCSGSVEKKIVKFKMIRNLNDFVKTWNNTFGNDSCVRDTPGLRDAVHDSLSALSKLQAAMTDAINGEKKLAVAVTPAVAHGGSHRVTRATRSAGTSKKSHTGGIESLEWLGAMTGKLNVNEAMVIMEASLKSRPEVWGPYYFSEVLDNQKTLSVGDYTRLLNLINKYYKPPRYGGVRVTRSSTTRRSTRRSSRRTSRAKTSRRQSPTKKVTPARKSTSRTRRTKPLVSFNVWTSVPGQPDWRFDHYKRQTVVQAASPLDAALKAFVSCKKDGACRRDIALTEKRGYGFEVVIQRPKTKSYRTYMMTNDSRGKLRPVVSVKRSAPRTHVPAKSSTRAKAAKSSSGTSGG